MNIEKYIQLILIALHVLLENLQARMDLLEERKLPEEVSSILLESSLEIQNFLN